VHFLTLHRLEGVVVRRRTADRPGVPRLDAWDGPGEGFAWHSVARKPVLKRWANWFEPSLMRKVVRLALASMRH